MSGLTLNAVMCETQACRGRMWMLYYTGMQSVAVHYLDEHEDDREGQSALWTPPALEALLFALTHDGSVRMRRAAIEAVGSVMVSK